MKLIAMFGAGALALGSLVATASPADAQRHGYGRHNGDYRGHHYRSARTYRGHYGYRGYGYRGGYRHRGYGRSRVVCRVHRGYYGPVRRCTRIYR